MLPNKFIGFKNYVTLISHADFHTAWKVSFIYSIGSAGLTFILGLILAHSLHRITKAKAFFRTLIILPWAVPLILSGLMWKWIFDQNIGLINYILSSLGFINENVRFLSDPTLALLSGIIATAYVHIPFVTVLIHAGLQNISQELYEAAEIDGADVFQKFFFITAPLNRIQMIFSFIVIWMFTFRTPDVFFSLTRGGPAKATYHAGLYLMDLIYRFLDFGQGATIGVMMFLTIIIVILPIVYFAIIRKWRE
jgi:multiple sugar transport system permease protein